MFKPSNGVEIQITWTMGSHVGADNAISAEDLAKSLLQSGHPINLPQLRMAIHDMRQRGYLIASSPKGYYLPKDLPEAMAYVDDQLRGPATDMLLTVRRQREAAREFFGSQLSMFG